jgi:hypothetical protein
MKHCNYEFEAPILQHSITPILQFFARRRLLQRWPEMV